MAGRTIAALAALVAVGVLGALILNGSVAGGSHTLRAGFDDAIQMTPGQEVRVAGRRVGRITEVDLVDGQAAVDLEITDDDVWPLPKGTTVRARWGSTTAYLGRYLELVPGPDGEGTLRDGAILGAADTSSAYELDEAYRIFRGRTKTDTAKALDRLAGTFGDRDEDLRKGVAAAPGGLDETASFLAELGADEERLRALARAGDRTTSALAGRSAELSSLMEQAASTFSELAQHTTAQQVALQRAPETFRTSVDVLRRLDGSLDGLDALVTDLRPGAPALRRLAVTASSTLRELAEVAPLAASTLRKGSTAMPRLKAFFDAAIPVMPDAAKALRTFAPMMSCLRPYAPELAGFLTTWTGIQKNYDPSGHYARSFPLSVMPALLPGTANTSAQALKLQPGLRYAMPRPPGLNAGKPQLVPECGAGADALDATKDPEARR